MSAQHLRPLIAFVTVAIVGAVVFANAFRAQDVVDAIRGGASDVIAGTPLLHDRLFVVEGGHQLDAAEPPEPEVDPPTGTGSAAGAPVAEATSSPDVGSPVPTPVVGNDSGTGRSDQSPPGGRGGQAPTQTAGDRPGEPKAPTTGKGQAGSGGPGGGEPGGHGKGHDVKGHDRGKGHDDGKSGHGKSGHDKSGHGKSGHGKSGHDKSGHDKSGHGKAKGHDKSGHGKSGHGKAKGHDKSGHGKSGHGKAKGHDKPGHDKPKKAKADRHR